MRFHIICYHIVHGIEREEYIRVHMIEDLLSIGEPMSYMIFTKDYVLCKKYSYIHLPTIHTTSNTHLDMYIQYHI